MLSVGSLTDTQASTPMASPSSPASPAVPVVRALIFVATVWEFAAVRAAFPGGRRERFQGRSLYRASVGPGECWVVQTGVGPQKARTTAQAILGKQAFSLAISSGFACALKPAAIGDMMVGTKAAAVDVSEAGVLDYVEIEGAERDRWQEAVSLCLPHPGAFISSERIVYRAADKMALAQRTQAMGLDMESAALAWEARAAQVPFLIVRSVSDLLMEELPLDFNLFLRPTGWFAGVCALLAHPSSLVGLARLRRQSVVAANTLTSCLRATVNARFGVRPDSPMTLTA